MIYVYKKIYLPLQREVRSSLQAIVGIGWHKSICMSSKVGIGYPFRMKRVNPYLFKLLEQVLNTCTWLEVRLRRAMKAQINLLISINCYKGLRHKDCLPVRGQRTRTNASTQKKKKKKKKKN